MYGKSGKLLLDEHPLILLPSLAVAIGLNAAVAVQQVHYWLKTTEVDKEKQKSHFFEDRWWVYNKWSEWKIQFPFWSESTIERIFAGLSTRGVFICQLHDDIHKGNWVTIDYAALDAMIDEGKPKRRSKWDGRQVDDGKVVNLTGDGRQLFEDLSSENPPEIIRDFSNTSERFSDENSSDNDDPEPVKESPPEAQKEAANDRVSHLKALQEAQKSRSEPDSKTKKHEMVVSLERFSSTKLSVKATAKLEDTAQWVNASGKMVELHPSWHVMWEKDSQWREYLIKVSWPAACGNAGKAPAGKLLNYAIGDLKYYMAWLSKNGANQLDPDTAQTFVAAMPKSSGTFSDFDDSGE